MIEKVDFNLIDFGCYQLRKHDTLSQSIELNLVHHLRRWPSIKTRMAQRLVLAGSLGGWSVYVVLWAFIAPILPIIFWLYLLDKDKAYYSKHKTFVWHLYNAGPTLKTWGRRCTNVIQMFCVCWATTLCLSRTYSIYSSIYFWFYLVQVKLFKLFNVTYSRSVKSH